LSKIKVTVFKLLRSESVRVWSKALIYLFLKTLELGRMTRLISSKPSASVEKDVNKLRYYNVKYWFNEKIVKNKDKIQI